jgi:hypothetical protein
MDGILALGRPDTISGDHNGVNSPSLMDVLISQKIISSKFFGIDIWRDADGGNNDGEINFGGPDSSRYDGSLNYVSAIKNSNGFWEIPASDAGVDGKSAGLTGRSAIIDSGTSFILMPPGDAQKLHALIPGSSQNGEAFTVPCDTSSKVQLSFGGKTYDISTKDYVGRALGGGACSSNVVGRQVFEASQWLVGDVFLKNVYAGFDFDGQRVGFGVKKATTVASSTSATANPTQTTSSRPSSPSTTVPTSTPIISLTIFTSIPSPTTKLPSILSSTYTSFPTASSISSTKAPQTDANTLSSDSSLTSSPTTESSHAATTTATDSKGSPIPTTFTAGFLPPGASLTTTKSSAPSVSTSAAGPAVQKGDAVVERPHAALLALFLALSCAAFVGV